MLHLCFIHTFFLTLLTWSMVHEAKKSSRDLLNMRSIQHQSVLNHPVCVSHVQDVTLPREREKDGKKEIHDVRLDFLATAEKGATPFQETNRPASARLYIFRCSSKPPFDKSRLSPRHGSPLQQHYSSADTRDAGTSKVQRPRGCEGCCGGMVPARTDNEGGRCDLEGIANARNASL